MFNVAKETIIESIKQMKTKEDVEEVKVLVSQFLSENGQDNKDAISLKFLFRKASTPIMEAAGEYTLAREVTATILDDLVEELRKTEEVTDRLKVLEKARKKLFPFGAECVDWDRYGEIRKAFIPEQKKVAKFKIAC